jgi:hypothetical protein
MFKTICQGVQHQQGSQKLCWLVKQVQQQAQQCNMTVWQGMQ